MMDTSIFDALLPPDAGLRIRHVSVRDCSVVIELLFTAPTAPCPDCGYESSSVHGRYSRRLQGEPCLGYALSFDVTARKFACRRPDCTRRVFCERLPGLAAPNARTTAELTDSHRAIGMALGGEAGSRLSARLAMPASPDTILRRVKSAPGEPAPPPRYVGVDDWAFRKGQSYGTILIDLERSRVIDILPGRDGEALKAWLAANPQVELITRDRWPAYIEAATEAAPQAKQVADRFHLLGNVREAVEKLLARHGPQIRAATAAVDSALGADPAEGVPPTACEEPERTSPKERRHGGKHESRQERFERVKELTAQGLSCRDIARRLGMNAKAVLRYRRLDRCPDWQPGRAGPTGLDPYAGLIAEWSGAGHRNAAELYRLLKGQGYRGGYDSVRRYLSRLIGSSGRPGRRGPDTRPPRRSAPSARKLSFRGVSPKPGGRSARILGRLREGHPDLHAALGLAEELMGMLRRQNATTLEEWSAKARAAGGADLKNLAGSLLGDAKAVAAALAEPWSNGRVEGHVNRLKTIKRQMYGRAGLPLLRARVKHKG